MLAALACDGTRLLWPLTTMDKAWQRFARLRGMEREWARRWKVPRVLGRVNDTE
jgi:hypothetical protein